MLEAKQKEKENKEMPKKCKNLFCQKEKEERKFGILFKIKFFFYSIFHLLFSCCVIIQKKKKKEIFGANDGISNL